MDDFSKAKLQLICPTLAEKIPAMEAMLGEDLSVQQALRSWQTQANLYEQGRTKPGNIVTKAPPGHSWHEFGMAVDVCPVRLLGTKNWSPDDPAWKKLESIGETLGLYPGAKFRTVVDGLRLPAPDLPHFQLTGKFPASPTDEVRQIFKDAGMEQLWREAGII